jgi:ubiquinone/menaquinone biosynthesis C-methylase UbiE
MTTNVTTKPETPPATADKIAGYFDDAYGEIWRTAYQSEEEKWYEYHPLRIRERLALALIAEEPKGYAVDLGCGNGHAALLMKTRHGFDKVTAIDISEEMLAAARELHKSKGIEGEVELIKADVEHLDMIDDASVDTCTALGVIEYLDVDATLLAEVFRILKPGGVAVIQTRNQVCIPVRVKTFIKNLIPALRLNVDYREHVPQAYRDEAKRQGFDVEIEYFSHFYALFPITLIPLLRKLIQPLDHWLSKQLERWAHRPFSRFLASMHIVKLRKPGA